MYLLSHTRGNQLFTQGKIMWKKKHCLSKKEENKNRETQKSVKGTIAEKGDISVLKKQCGI